MTTAEALAVVKGVIVGYQDVISLPDVDRALAAFALIDARVAELEAALREIVETDALFGGGAMQIIARRALQPKEEAPPQAGDLLVMPYRHGDIIPAGWTVEYRHGDIGWTVEGDKMWRRADASDAALQPEEEA